MSPAKAVPVSKEHSMSGQGQQERQGGNSRAPNVDLQASLLPNQVTHCLMGQAIDQTV
jgi:hypothetical protein